MFCSSHAAHRSSLVTFDLPARSQRGVASERHFTCDKNSYFLWGGRFVYIRALVRHCVAIPGQNRSTVHFRGLTYTPPSTTEHSSRASPGVMPRDRFGGYVMGGRPGLL